MDFLLSGAAASTACLFTNPLEVVKTRMQLQGELRARGSYRREYRHVFHAVRAIARAEGLAGLQRGLLPGLLYQFSMNGVRLGAYGALERGGHTGGALRSTAAGAAAGVMGALLGSPAYLVKTHLQVQSNSETAVGHQHPHRGMVHAFRSIHREHGILGLWRGAGASVPRVTVGSAAQLSTFSSSKEVVNNLGIFTPDSWLVALCASMISSVVVVVAMTPFDVVSTRLYNQPVDQRGKTWKEGVETRLCLNHLKSVEYDYIKMQELLRRNIKNVREMIQSIEIAAQGTRHRGGAEDPEQRKDLGAMTEQHSIGMEDGSVEKVQDGPGQGTDDSAMESADDRLGPRITTDLGESSVAEMHCQNPSVAAFLACSLPGLPRNTDITHSDGHAETCLAFSSSQGHAVVKLAEKICPVAVTVEYFPKGISALADICSAPKDFAVYGSNDAAEAGTLLGQFMYSAGGEALQAFHLARRETP